MFDFLVSSSAISASCPFGAILSPCLLTTDSFINVKVAPESSVMLNSSCPGPRYVSSVWLGMGVMVEIATGVSRCNGAARSQSTLRQDPD